MLSLKDIFNGRGIVETFTYNNDSEKIALLTSLSPLYNIVIISDNPELYNFKYKSDNWKDDTLSPFLLIYPSDPKLEIYLTNIHIDGIVVDTTETIDYSIFPGSILILEKV